MGGENERRGKMGRGLRRMGEERRRMGGKLGYVGKIEEGRKGGIRKYLGMCRKRIGIGWGG